MSDEGAPLSGSSPILALVCIVGVWFTANFFPDFLWLWMIVIAIASIPLILCLLMIPIVIYVFIKRKFCDKNYEIKTRANDD